MNFLADGTPGQPTIRMLREDWEKWDAALRSGKYSQQTRGFLYRNGYCCLGVLEHVLDGAVEHLSLPSNTWLNDHGIAFLNDEYEDGNWSAQAPVLRYDSVQRVTKDAAQLNDAGLPFEQIADYIAQVVEFTDA